MKKFYNFLKKKCDEHNEKLTYIDYEECWTPGTYILSFIFYSLILPGGMFFLGLAVSSVVLMSLSFITSGLFIFWHIYQLLN